LAGLAEQLQVFAVGLARQWRAHLQFTQIQRYMVLKRCLLVQCLETFFTKRRTAFEALERRILAAIVAAFGDLRLVCHRQLSRHVNTYLTDELI
jgi:hypothetical protein